MLFIISLLFVLVFCALLHRPLKKHANLFYVGSVLMAIGIIVTYQMDLTDYVPKFINDYVLSIFKRGAVSTAIFTVVMYAGTLNKKSSMTKVFMPIRAELSIIACIFTLGHNIIYGVFFFPTLFTNPGSLEPLKLVATILTLLLISMMLPLMITSFPKVRAKMKFKNWKNLQRMAYPFYGLIYVHVMCLFIPKIQKGQLTDVIIYTAIFLTYLVLRVRRYVLDQKKKNNKNHVENQGMPTNF